MGKRAPILPEGYNPVGEALKKAVKLQPSVFLDSQKQATENKVIDFHREEIKVEHYSDWETSRPSESIIREKEPIPEIPTDKELKLTSFRFRCTESERKKWHSIAQELTGEHSQLSHFARAAFMLMENAFDELQRVAPDIQRLKYPAKTDPMGLALYEQRLAEFLFDAIKVSGRPRG
jgi:hypothetical protein